MKKIFAFLLVCGTFTGIQNVNARSMHRQMIYTPVVTTYSCSIGGERCRVTELSYLEIGRSYYKAACTGDHMDVSRFENRAMNDVEQKSRRYCSVDF